MTIIDDTNLIEEMDEVYTDITGKVYETYKFDWRKSRGEINKALVGVPIQYLAYILVDELIGGDGCFKEETEYFLENLLDNLKKNIEWIDIENVIYRNVGICDVDFLNDIGKALSDSNYFSKYNLGDVIKGLIKLFKLKYVLLSEEERDNILKQLGVLVE